MRRLPRSLFVLLEAMAVAAVIAPPARALTPLNDLADGLYLNQFQGGLYQDGSNDMPAAHAAEGIARASAIQRRNVLGELDAEGKYVLVSIGMSNTTQEFCGANQASDCRSWTLMGQAAVHPDVEDSSLSIVNGAAGGKS